MKSRSIKCGMPRKIALLVFAVASLGGIIPLVGLFVYSFFYDADKTVRKLFWYLFSFTFANTIISLLMNFIRTFLTGSILVPWARATTLISYAFLFAQLITGIVFFFMEDNAEKNARESQDDAVKIDLTDTTEKGNEDTKD